MNLPTLHLSDSELAHINLLLDQTGKDYCSAEQPELIDAAAIIAQSFPIRVREFLYEFKLRERDPVCLIKGYPINDDSLGDTPSHWAGHPDAERTKREQIMFVLCSALLGEMFGWLTQQDSYLIHDVFPIRGYEHDQIGSGSEALLLWHTEDAHHPARGDYLGLMCLRNPDQSVTTVGCVDSLAKLTKEQLNILRQPRFVIRPDDAHQAKNGYQQEVTLDPLTESAYFEIHAATVRHDKPVPLLSGGYYAPYLCIDPAYMTATDPEAELVLQILIDTIEAELVDVILQPGDICFVDNFRAVHGRKPFKARYDGRDRWLKRINITRDLRKSRAYRSVPHSRIIDTFSF